MIGSVIGALVVGLIGVFAIVIAQGIVAGQNTSGWPTVLVSIITNIAPVIGIVAIVYSIVALRRDAEAIISLIRRKLNSWLSVNFVTSSSTG